ncbi:MAG: hypothetical protein SFY68_09345 [Candidatus Sumerlaeia bacterium]|nr:hypothetical protein [Candidatus Sumerlaeia bacterium]
MMNQKPSNPDKPQSVQSFFGDGALQGVLEIVVECVLQAIFNISL